MQTRVYPPLVEAFLILEQPRQRLSHWSKTLSALDDDRVPSVATVTAYYDASCDQALVGLRYNEFALGHERLAFVIELALIAEIGMIQPSELSEDDRHRFLSERLARCTLNVTDQRSVVTALSKLVARVPKGTRDNVARLGPKSDITEQVPVVRRTRAATRRGGRSSTRNMSPHVIARAPAPLPRPRPATEQRKSTVQMDPLDAQKLAAADLASGALRAITKVHEAVKIELTPPPERPPEPPPTVIEPTNAPYQSSPDPLPTKMIFARYLRSGRWIPIRIGALSLRGATLMSGALPRVEDHVDVALAFGEHRALVRGPVQKVSTPDEIEQSGTASFSAAFVLDEKSRRNLTALLTAARAAAVTIKPPPARASRRFPVEWSVTLGTQRGPVRTAALDVSRDGLFVRGTHTLAIDANIRFSVGVDDGGSPVTGRARVMRCLEEADGRYFGVPPGYGLSIVELNDIDRERWIAFLARIEKRADKRVLLGAAPARLGELQGALAAAGYAVVAATGPEALMQLASQERQANACVIDALWSPPPPATTWGQALFPGRPIPCVAFRGDPRRARVAIDKALAIASGV